MSKIYAFSCHVTNTPKDEEMCIKYVMNFMKIIIGEQDMALERQKVERLKCQRSYWKSDW